MNKISILLSTSLLTLLLGGCLGIPQSPNNWNKVGVSDDQMRRDMISCRQYGMQSAQSHGVAGNMFVEAWIIQEANQCMADLGYRQGASSGSTKTGMAEVTAIRTEMEKKKRLLCDTSDFKSYYLKTSCLPLEITKGQLTDHTKMTSSQLVVLAKVRTAEDLLYKDERRNLLMVGATGTAVVEILDAYKGSLNKNISDLESGKVTWGEYNLRRKEIATETNASIGKLPPN